MVETNGGRSPEAPAPPSIVSLGEGGILFAGGSTPILAGNLRALKSAREAAPGHLLLLEASADSTGLAELETFLAETRWCAHLPEALAEPLRRKPQFYGRLSTIHPGFSFMIEDSEVDVLPRGPEASGLALLLDWEGILLLYPTRLPDAADAEEWWTRFHLRRFLLPFPGREAILAWSSEVPLEGDSRDLAEAAGAHLYVETGAEWRAWPMGEGDALRAQRGQLQLERKG